MSEHPHATGNPQRNGRVLHVGGPNVGDRKIFDQLVDEIFERRWFTNGGEVVKKFEKRLCEHLGVKHCIPVCNATLGLQIACRALELEGEVILPAFTFVATPHAVCWERLRPVFADVNCDTHSLCPESVLSLINSNTSAIMGVHLWGNPCEVETLQEIADDHGLKLIFDAAHAFSCSHRGTMIGNFGDCEVFSFHATKFFNTFEGGAIATNDDKLAEKIRLLKNFGFAGQNGVVHLGTNAKMSEISAAMGISMFGCIDQIAEKNRCNFEHYSTFLKNVRGLRVYSLSHLVRANWQYVVVEVDEEVFGASRDHVLDSLIQNDILAKRYFFPGCHNFEPYKNGFRASGRRLVNTDKLCQRTLCLPTGNSVEPWQIAEVCDVILQARPASGVPHKNDLDFPRKAAG